MKEFFLTLFFSKFILITPNPVDLDIGVTLIKLKEPLEAITPGASIQIDVTSILKLEASDGVMEAKEKANQLLPRGALSASIGSQDSLKTTLYYDGNILYSNGQVLVSLHNKDGVPVDLEFTSLEINCTVKLTQVEIYWRNYNL